MAKAGKSRWAIVIAILAVVAVAAGILIFTGGQSEAKQFATLQVREGQVDVRKAGAGFQPGRDGQALAQGDLVRTGPDGIAEITYFDGSLTRLGPDTEFTIEELSSLDNDAKSKRIKGSHDRGRTWNRVEKLADSASRFEIETPVATAAARGTVFATFCDFFENCTIVAIEDTTEVLMADGTVITLNALDAVTINADGTPGEVIHFDSLDALIEAFEWVDENACDIEEIVDCEPAEPEPTPTVTPLPGPSPTDGTSPEPIVEPAAEPPSNSVPAADFAPASATGGAPLTVEFTNLSSDPDGDALTFVWDFGDGTPLSAAVNPSHTFGLGTWNVTLTARDGAGATDSATHTISALDMTAPAPPVITSPSGAGVIGSVPITFSGDAEQGSVVRLFDGGSQIGSDQANSPFVIVASLADGSHSITATATDGAGNESGPSDPLLLDVEAVNDPPTASLSVAPGSGTLPLAVSFDGSGSSDSDDPLDSWVLAFGDESTDASGSGTPPASIPHTYSPAGQFVATLTVIDARGATDTDTATVDVSEPPNAEPNAVNDTATTDEDDAVTIDVLLNDTDSDGDTLDITSVGTPADGGAQIVLGDAGEEIQYTPDSDFNGADSFTYAISDGNGGTDSATVNLTVDPVDDEGSASLTADEPEGTAPHEVTFTIDGEDPDGLVSWSLVFGDEDTEGVSVASTNGAWPPPAAGVAHTYELPGEYTATLTVTDSEGGTSQATTGVTVNAPNAGPTAVLLPETDTGHWPYTVSFDGSGSSDPDDGIASWSLDFGDDSTDASGTGTPLALILHEYENPGVYTATLTVTDGEGLTDTDTSAITVTNTAPNADDDTQVTEENNSVFVDVLDNDEDPDGDELTIVSVGDPANGFAEIVETESGGQAVEYTPDEGFVGNDTFTYTISDGQTTDSANVSVTVNAPPDAVEDAYLTTDDEDTDAPGINIGAENGVLANDVDDEAITATLVGDPSGVTLNADGSFTVLFASPYEDLPVQFAYSACDPLGACDTATVTVSEPAVELDAVNDTASQTGEPIYIDVLENDHGTGIFVESFTQPGSSPTQGEGADVHRSEAEDNSNTLVYAPGGGFSGTDSFTYTIEDENGDRDTATVTIEGSADSVTIVLHWPAVGRDLDLHVQPPTGLQLYYGLRCLEGATLPCWAEQDIDVTQGPPGTETDTIYTLDPNYQTGGYVIYIDNFSCGQHTYEGTGATVTVNTASGSQTFSLPTGDQTLRQWNVGTLTLGAAGAGSVTPAQTFSGGFCGNNPPVAVDDELQTAPNTPLTFSTGDLEVNDYDLEFDDFHVASIDASSAQGGIIQEQFCEGSYCEYIYTPPADIESDSFDYVLVDDNLNSGEESVGTVTVLVGNSAPVAEDDEITASIDRPKTFSPFELLWNDVDPEEDEIRVLEVDPASTEGGTVVLLNGEDPENAQIEYTPPAEYTGPDSFTYTVVDVYGATDPGSVGTVNVTVLGEEPPVAVDDPDPEVRGEFVVPPGAPTELASSLLTINDHDPNDDPLSIISVDGSSSLGTVAMAGSGGVLYTPPDDFQGLDTFTYTIGDGTGFTDSATVTVAVDDNPCTEFGCVNEPPVAGPDFASTPEGTLLTLSQEDLFVNDFDPNGDAFFILGVDAASVEDGGEPGVHQVNGVTFVTYRANAGFTGIDSFSYYLVDEWGNGFDEDTGVSESAGLITVTVGSEFAGLAAPEGSDERLPRSRRHGGDAASTGSGATLSRLRAELSGTSATLTWDEGIEGVARWSTTEYPTRPTAGTEGCRGVGECRIDGLPGGSTVYVTVFSERGRVTPVVDVNAVQVAVPASTEPIPTEPTPTEPTPIEPTPTEPAPTEPAPTEPTPAEPPPPEPLEPAPADEATPPPEPVATEPPEDPVEVPD